MADAKTREASLITFVAAAANITLFGIGGAFWGLVIGLVAYAVLNGRLPQRAQASQTALQTTPEPIVVKGAAN
jgi:benzoate membrane transport protein